jgi:hypothetical protein
MSNIVAFSLDYLQPDDVEDTQAKLLNNALRRFCDEIIVDSQTTDAEKSVLTREVVWNYGSYHFRAKLVTFDSQVSICQYDFAYKNLPNEWYRLTTPRALAEKLTEAKEINHNWTGA